MNYSVRKNSQYSKYSHFVIVTPWGLLQDDNGVCCFFSKEDAEREIEVIR